MVASVSSSGVAGWAIAVAQSLTHHGYAVFFDYLGIASGDFEQVIVERHLENLWQTMEEQFKSALRIRPVIISNGREDGWIMPSHLTTMGFYVLRVNKKLSEMRDVLKQ